MPSSPVSRSWRRGFAGLSGVALAALVAAYAALCFVYLWVFSTGHWTAGVVVASVARAREGGAYYEGAGSLLGPSWPYFPLSLLLGRGVAAVGVPLLSLPAVLGGASAFLLPVSAAVLARHLGARWLPSLALSFALHALILPRYRIFELVAGGFFPDASVALLLILACAALGAVEQAEERSWPATAALGACLVAAGLAKQVGLAGVAGCFAYLVLFSPAPWAARRKAIAVVLAAGLVVAAVVLALPGCFEVTIVAIARHPRDWSRLGVVWTGLAGKQSVVGLLYLLGLAAVVSSPPEMRRRFLCLHCVLLPMLAVQLLATVKEGGGGEGSSYNMELVMLMLLPVVVWAGAARLSRAPDGPRAAVVAAVAAAGAWGALDVRGHLFDQRALSWRPQVAAAAELETLGHEGLVLASETQVWAVHRAGFRIATGNVALWHYAVGDPLLQRPGWIEGVERALREQRYALVSPMWLTGLPPAVVDRLGAEIRASYVPVRRSGWMVPRAR